MLLKKNVPAAKYKRTAPELDVQPHKQTVWLLFWFTTKIRMDTAQQLINNMQKSTL